MFRFKQFEVQDDDCAMKVGTDAVLLGAWAANTMHDAQGTMHVLDIGTGSGVIALMLAQQFVEAQILGIDIDETAIRQAQANFAKSPWPERLSAQCISLQEFTLHPTPLHPYTPTPLSRATLPISVPRWLVPTRLVIKRGIRTP